MPLFEYKGPAPVVDDAGVLVHPGDRREMDEPPPWGPWDPVPHFSGEVPEAPRGEPGDPGPFVNLDAVAASAAAAKPQPEGM